MSELSPKQRFAKYFPDRVEKVVKTLGLIENCSNKSNYEWDPVIMHDLFILLAQAFIQCADKFGVQFEILIDGTEVQYVRPKRRRKSS